MWIYDLLKSLAATPTRRRTLSRQGRGSRLKIEPLEDRIVFAFLTPVDYATGWSPYSVLTDDFNRDGIQDLALANSIENSGSISVRLGNADGTFNAAANSATDVYHAESLAVGDFNTDGKPDLVIANSTRVTVLPGNGDGVFGGPVHVDVGTNAQSVAVGDFNADGKLDLGVTSNFMVFDGYGSYGEPLHHDEGLANVLLGNGAGSFSAPSSTWLGEGFHRGAAASDFDGDGRDDFAAAGTDDYGRGKVRVLLASSDNSGVLLPPTNYSTGTSPASVILGDANGDGISDLITRDSSSATVLLGNGSAGVGDGTFQPSQTTALDFSPASLAVGDIGGDGKLDLVATSNAYTCTSQGYYYCYDGHWTGHVSVLLGHGNGSFAPSASSDIEGGYLTGLAIGDFNGDGFPDAVVTDSNHQTASILINDQAWEAEPLPPPAISISDVTLAEGNTGSVNATFTLTLSAAHDTEVTVHYATANNSATAGTDYTATSGDVTFAAGQMSQSITIAVLGDRLPELTESWFVDLSAPTNAVLADSQGVGTIVDDEPRISISDVSAKEGKKGQTTLFTFTIVLSTAYDEAVTMSFRTADGTAKTSDKDYVAKTGTLTFAPGETIKTITIEVKGDNRKEPNEAFYLDLFGNSSNSLLTKHRGLGTILDDD